jgi:hypothetical protein
MGRLELPLPKLGKGKQSLEVIAKDMQERIRARAPKDLRETIIVKLFTKDGQTGLAIDYDDRVESIVYVAIEYPARSGKKETVLPRNQTR